jgi:hypothetical protein
LKPVIRRAKCLSCGNVFPVGDIVQRLLALPQPGTTAGFVPDLVAAQHEPLEHAATPAPSLSLNDLDSTDSDILEKTLVTVPDTLPEAKAEATSPYPPEITESTLSGYTSARDAIQKLFGSGQPTAAGLKSSSDPSDMDMEATLSALDNTLGGASAAPTPPAQSGNAAATELSEEDLAGPSSSTMRLSHEDLLAAIAAKPAAAAAASASGTPADPTVPLRPSNLLGTSEDRGPAGPRPTTTRALPSTPESGEPSAEMLRLKIGEDVYGGLTMPQLIAWVEEGRVLENHLVARQHSENWLEAHKVPGLRPVFERLRRERSSGAPSLDSNFEEPAPKKSLFGGLFGKN